MVIFLIVIPPSVVGASWNSDVSSAATEVSAARGSRPLLRDVWREECEKHAAGAFPQINDLPRDV